MNFRFIFDSFCSKKDPESHQNLSKMHPEISSFFRPHSWSIFDHFVILFSTLFAASWSSAFHFTRMLKTQISLQIPWIRRVGREVILRFLQKINEFLPPPFATFLASRKAPRMHPKWTPKLTQIDARVVLESKSKNMFENSHFFDAKWGPVWDHFRSKNLKKGATLKDPSGSGSRSLFF